MAKTNIAAAVREAIEPTVAALGYRLWDVAYGKEGADYHLTVTIDSDDGITLNDCEAVHRAIDPILDAQDPIEDAYYLDVSSPGVERELRTGAHIAASLSSRVEVRLFAPMDGKKILRGTLCAFDGTNLTLETDDGTVTLPRAAASKIRTLFFD